MCNVWTLTLSLLTKVNEDMTIVCVGIDRTLNQLLIAIEVFEFLTLISTNKLKYSISYNKHGTSKFLDGIILYHEKI